MDKKELEHLAELSKLEFSDEELEAFSKEFESVIEFANIVKNSDIDGVSVLNVKKMQDLRDDEVEESFAPEILLKNAPVAKKNSFVVPRIME